MYDVIPLYTFITSGIYHIVQWSFLYKTRQFCIDSSWSSFCDLINKCILNLALLFMHLQTDVIWRSCKKIHLWYTSEKEFIKCNICILQYIQNPRNYIIRVRKVLHLHGYLNLILENLYYFSNAKSYYLQWILDELNRLPENNLSICYLV